MAEVLFAVTGTPYLALNVCHVPVAMPATRIHGESPFPGYRGTGFPNFPKEEAEAVGLPDSQWLLEDEREEEVGVDYSSGEVRKPYMVEGRSLIIGQHLLPAEVRAERLLKASV
ncbi:hypothetical protein AB0M87_14590 [Streptomyces sp. NPDC051320]|uniref:hypothetical protein n=1 Tax=Streptomyces sp. NPDC051320 TaxID=3154644 RepID=UPI00341C1F14